MTIKYIITIPFILLTTILIAQETSKLTINIDERIETIYAVAYFAEYKLVTNHDNIYKKELSSKFIRLKQHKVVAIFDTLSTKYNFSYYRIVEWTLQFSNFPEFKKENKLVEQFTIVPEHKKYLLEEFRKELILFNRDTLFQNYIQSVASTNRKIINQIEESQTIDKLPLYLESFYGIKLNSYNLILSPLLHSGGFNAELFNRKEKIDVFALIGPNGEIDFVPYFEKEFIEMDIIIHEFGHSFIRPIFQEYKKEIENLESKYFNSKLQKNASFQGYSDWNSVFNELIVRANTIMITKKYFGNEKSDNLMKFEKNVGFGLVEKIIPILNYYELNRKLYPTFNQFFPELLNRL